MSIGNSSETRLAFVAETTLGTTPATPSFQKLRFNGEGLKINRSNVTSNEMRQDRNVTDLIQVGGGASGPINGELSYGTLDAFLAAALATSWSSDVAVNGTTVTGFTLEKTFELGATDSFLRHKGMVPDRFGLNVRAGQIITWDMDFMGLSGESATSAITGATYANANTKDVMSAANQFASLSVAGTTPTVLSVSLNTTNNIRGQEQSGSKDKAGLGLGRFEATGSIEAYFENATLYDKFLNGDSGAMSFNLGSVTNEKYTVSAPKIKFSDGDILAGGNDQDLIVKLPFRALYDDTTGGSLKVTRAVA